MARAIGVAPRAINEIVHARRSITARDVRTLRCLLRPVRRVLAWNPGGVRFPQAGGREEEAQGGYPPGFHPASGDLTTSPSRVDGLECRSSAGVSRSQSRWLPGSRSIGRVAPRSRSLGRIEGWCVEHPGATPAAEDRNLQCAAGAAWVGLSRLRTQVRESEYRAGAVSGCKPKSRCRPLAHRSRRCGRRTDRPRRAARSTSSTIRQTFRFAARAISAPRPVNTRPSVRTRVAETPPLSGCARWSDRRPTRDSPSPGASSSSRRRRRA